MISTHGWLQGEMLKISCGYKNLIDKNYPEILG